MLFRSLRDLGWQAKEGEHSQDFVNYINNLKPSDGANLIFETESEALAAGLAPGTIVTIGGRKAKV